MALLIYQAPACSTDLLTIFYWCAGSSPAPEGGGGGTVVVVVVVVCVALGAGLGMMRLKGLGPFKRVAARGMPDGGIYEMKDATTSDS